MLGPRFALAVNLFDCADCYNNHRRDTHEQAGSYRYQLAV